MITVMIPYNRLVELRQENAWGSSYDELEYWCHCNCQWHYRSNHTPVTDGTGRRGVAFHFMDVGEAILFKMTWA